MCSLLGGGESTCFPALQRHDSEVYVSGKPLRVMCLSQSKPPFIRCPSASSSARKKRRSCQERHTLPVAEFKRDFPVDAATFKTSGKSRSPKPQKSTCMVVHGRRSAVASVCVPAVTLLSSGRSGFSAAGPPATFNFTILGSLVDGLWPVKCAAAGT